MNFQGAGRELREAFAAIEPQLKERLANHQIKFKLSPPAPPGAPHFGGAWEREIQSVKKVLQVLIGAQPLQDVLLTVLAEVECILNSRPIGYVSSDVADLDPVMPNICC